MVRRTFTRRYLAVTVTVTYNVGRLSAVAPADPDLKQVAAT